LGLDFEDTDLTLRLPGSLAAAVPDPDRKRSSSDAADAADNSSPLAAAADAPPAPKYIQYTASSLVFLRARGLIGWCLD
jgi:hypothetical protein